MTHTTPVTHESPEWVLMAKALQGELSDEEQKAFTAWLSQDEAHATQWAEATEAWQKTEAVQHKGFEPNVARAWEKFCAKAELNTLSPAPEQTREAVVRPMFSFTSFTKYAALFVLAAGLAWLGYTQIKDSGEWVQMATLTGERKVFYLPDSSRVVLNENSTLRYQEAFTGKERLVELTGEGFFEVQKNPSKPFVINSGNAQTKVLGTSFNVKAIDKAEEVTVTVSTGKVSFSSLETNNQVILTPGFTGRMLGNGTVAKSKTIDDSSISWQTLKYEGARLIEIESSLEKYFGVDISLSDNSLQHCTFTGTFTQPDLKEILAVLAASNGLSITQPATNKYVIAGTGCL